MPYVYLRILYFPDICYKYFFNRCSCRRISSNCFMCMTCGSFLAIYNDLIISDVSDASLSNTRSTLATYGWFCAGSSGWSDIRGWVVWGFDESWRSICSIFEDPFDAARKRWWIGGRHREYVMCFDMYQPFSLNNTFRSFRWNCKTINIKNSTKQKHWMVMLFFRIFNSRYFSTKTYFCKWMDW